MAVVMYACNVPNDLSITEGAVCYLPLDSPIAPRAVVRITHGVGIVMYAVANISALVTSGRIALPSRQRTHFKIAFTDALTVVHDPMVIVPIRALTLMVESPQVISLDHLRTQLDQLKYITNCPIGTYYTALPEPVAVAGMKAVGAPTGVPKRHIVTVTALTVDGQPAEDFTLGLIGPETRIEFSGRGDIFDDNPETFMNFDLSKMDVGGCAAQLDVMLRRAFSTRMLPQDLIEKLKIRHVRGMVLYGVPGTGKTLIARELSQQLRCSSLKIVNGPELLDKFVGASEKKIRDLFAEAEADSNPRNLHMIVCDEFDALCRARSSGGSLTSQVNDNIVGQLLSKLDGMRQGNNVFFIAITNRPDLLDPAILRPGRLELRLEIGLPDAGGRLDILRIHTRDLETNGYLAGDVSLEALAKQLEDYTGAELAAVVGAARSYAITRAQDTARERADNGAATAAAGPIQGFMVTAEDFQKAIQTDIQPKYGRQSLVLPEVRPITAMQNRQIIDWSYIALMPSRILIVGGRHSGKTNLGYHIIGLHCQSNSRSGTDSASSVRSTGFSCIKTLRIEDYGRLPESAKLGLIESTFDACLRATSSLLFIDDLDRLLEWSPLGYRYNNNVLQLLLTHLRLGAGPDSRFKVIVTCHVGTTDLTRLLELTEVFDSIITTELPPTGAQDFRGVRAPLK